MEQKLDYTHVEGGHWAKIRLRDNTDLVLGSLGKVWGMSIIQEEAERW